jgi:hypothetical protein
MPQYSLILTFRSRIEPRDKPKWEIGALGMVELLGCRLIKGNRIANCLGHSDMLDGMELLISNGYYCTGKSFFR